MTGRLRHAAYRMTRLKQLRTELWTKQPTAAEQSRASHH
ncbi:hypothetical protein HOE425_331019 [Hoeflea sp. EC-HK425]|nr:hypothetical protein HOE425_331019 [Hoeflea sp. EC-HK425]